MKKEMPTTTGKSQSSVSYLDRLTFDPALLSGVVGMWITNIRLVLLSIITILLLGTIAYTQLPKRLNPEVKIPIVTIITVLPGAGPADVESLVTIPIEDQLRSLKGVDILASSSLDNVSAITLQFLSSVDRDTAKDQVQAAVDSVNDLPADAQDPKVTALDFEDQPIWTFALLSEKSYPDLMHTAKDLENAIEESSKVDRVIVGGYDEQEIIVEADANKLAQYGLNPFTLSSLIKKTRSSYPAGVIQTEANSFALTIDPAIDSIDDIRNLQISVGGSTVALSDIATVAYRSKPGTHASYLATPESEGTSAVTFAVHKTSGENIDTAGTEVKKIVDDFMKIHSDGYKIVTFSNTSEEMVKQFGDLLKEFRTTIILVMVVLFLFLGLRQSLISSLTVPLTFLSAFFFMQFFGMSINFLTLFAFLLSLGLLVDDTIVVVSAMTMYYKSGRFTPTQTGALVWKDTIIPIWSTTITTIWSFVPLLLTSGIIGEFIKPIPVVVTVTMISSTAIAVLITLPLMIVILKPAVPSRVITLLKVILWLTALAIIGSLTMKSPVFPLVLLTYVLLTLISRRVFPAVRTKTTQFLTVQRRKFSRVTALYTTITQKYADTAIIDVEPFAHWYKQKILTILKSKSSRRKVLAAVVIYSIFSFALLPMGFVKNEFFPKTDQNQLFVQLELPAGTIEEITRKETIKILDVLREFEEVEYVSADMGRGAPSGFGGSASGSNYVTFTLRLTEKEHRSIPSYTISEAIRTQFVSYTAGKISVIEESGGPPAGSDLQIKLLGEDLGELHTQADAIVAYLQTQSGVTNISKSVKEGTSKIAFVPDNQKLAVNGFTPDTIGFALRLYASGFTLDSIEFDKGSGEKTDVSLRLGTGTLDVAGLSTLSVTNQMGKSVPLLSLGTLQARANPTSISREDHRRTLSVAAAVRPGVSITEENKKLEEFAKTLKLKDGYEWQTGGVNEENAKSIQSIMQAMVLSSVLILITMVIQFGSFRQAIIVLIVIPLAVSSVFLAYALTGTPLSFPSMIGILSLFGIVVTNSMFIVDKINLNRKEGMPFDEAIADAGASRMEPIILTKLCTVFGLLPITIADPLWRGLGGAIISGLLIASTIMLLFIPVLYYEWMNENKATGNRS